MVSDNAGSPPMCDVCGEVERRYCCPRCGAMTCSLGCCKQHKSDTGCSGRRDRTGFVGMRAFGEQELRSDFHFLEDAAVEVDRAKRARYRDSVSGKRWSRQGPPSRAPTAAAAAAAAAAAEASQPHALLLNAPHGLVSTTNGGTNHGHGPGQKLVRKAEQAGVTLLLMPQGMSRQSRNTTVFQARSGSISWRVEWEFPRAQPEPLQLDSRLDHDTTWIAWLRRTLADDQPQHREGQAVTRHALRAYVAAVRAYLQAQNRARLGKGNGGPEAERVDFEVDHAVYFRLMLRKEPHAANEPLYYSLDPEATVKDSVAGKTLIEFPTVHVVLADDAAGYPLVPALVTELPPG